MAIKNTEELFKRVLAAHTGAEMEILLKELGDSTGVRLNETFGSLNCSWVPYGDSESNESTIGLATKAGRSITERVTNAIDALLELARARSTGNPPNNPAAATKEWYGRAPTGPRQGLYQSEDKEGDLSRHVCVVLSDSGVATAPTIDVIDSGIGLDPAEMPQTILSLQQGNKIKKPYLMGTWGQGGASTLAFCKYALFVSRDHASPDTAGFTIVRVVDPGEDYELLVYAYLLVDECIPSINLGPKPLAPYASANLRRPPTLSHGTLVRHIGFNLSGLHGSLGPTPNNPYHYLHVSMFDPLLPFRVMDIRGKFARDERVGGSRNRLMKLVEKGQSEDDPEAGNIVAKHHHEMEYIVPHGSTEPSIGVEYWVIEAMRKNKGELRLRSSSSELFVQRGYPIVATLNGQNQGELPAKFVRDLGLGMVAKHIVVHIDASKTDRSVRRQLFSTTREGFKEPSDQLDNLTKTLAKMLKDDKRLAQIEQELTDRLVNRDARATSEKVKKQITRLLRDAGFSKTAAGEGDQAGEEDAGGPGGAGFGRRGGGGGGGGGEPTQALPTLPFPNVTKWDIESPTGGKVRVRLEGRSLLRIATDADSRFDDEGLISLEIDPEKVEVASVSGLRGGRKQWRLRPAEGANVGDAGTVTAVLRMPGGGELRSAIQFELLAPAVTGRTGPRALVPDFEVLPISPDKDEDTEIWNQLWPDQENASRATKAEVAYKVFAAGDKTIVYYSTGFGPYQDRVERLKSKSTALAEAFEENYQIWIGYHAILQLPDEQKAEERDLQALETERCRVAQVQIRIAHEMAEMQRKLARVSDAED